MHVQPTPTAEQEWHIAPTSGAIPRELAAVLVCPLTLNTLSGWATGRNDSAALGVLNGALGLGTPVLAVPTQTVRLTSHPAYPEHLATLSRAGVTFLDLTTGRPNTTPAPIPSGTGDRYARRAVDSILGWLDQALAAPRN